MTGPGETDIDTDWLPTTEGDSLPSERAPDQTQATFDRRFATRLKNTEQWLMEERTSWSVERRLLENLIRFKDDDLEEHRQRLATTEVGNAYIWTYLFCLRDTRAWEVPGCPQCISIHQRQARRLWQELKECWTKLLQRRRLHDQMVTDNIRLRAKNIELRVLIAQMGHKCSEQEKTFRFQCMDMEL